MPREQLTRSEAREALEAITAELGAAWTIRTVNEIRRASTIASFMEEGMSLKEATEYMNEIEGTTTIDYTGPVYLLGSEERA